MSHPHVHVRDFGKYVIVVYDVKHASESKTSPHSRVAPLKEIRLRKLLSATLDARRQSAGNDSICVLPGDRRQAFPECLQA